jgi:hypothetical protein
MSMQPSDSMKHWTFVGQLLLKLQEEFHPWTEEVLHVKHAGWAQEFVSEHPEYKLSQPSVCIGSRNHADCTTIIHGHCDCKGASARHCACSEALKI